MVPSPHILSHPALDERKKKAPWPLIFTFGSFQFAAEGRGKRERKEKKRERNGRAMLPASSYHLLDRNAFEIQVKEKEGKKKEGKRSVPPPLTLHSGSFTLPYIFIVALSLIIAKGGGGGGKEEGKKRTRNTKCPYRGVSMHIFSSTLAGTRGKGGEGGKGRGRKAL